MLFLPFTSFGCRLEFLFLSDFFVASAGAVFFSEATLRRSRLLGVEPEEEELESEVEREAEVEDLEPEDVERGFAGDEGDGDLGADLLPLSLVLVLLALW